MNLGPMLREGSLVDHTWWNSGLVKQGEVTFDPIGHNRNNDIKPELQMELGLGDLSHIFDEKNSGEVKRNIPEKDLGDAGPVIVFARSLMNAGAPAQVVDRELRRKFAKTQLAREVKSLKKQFRLDGIVGRFVLDGRVPGGCAAAMRQASRSPYKRFIKYVIGCSCGDPQLVPDDRDNMSVVASTGNALDDFFAQKPATKTAMVPHCRTTMMRILASMDDLDEEWLEDTLLDVSNVTGIPMKPADEPSQKWSVAARAKHAFQMIDRIAAKKDAAKYAGKVDASEFMMDVADNDIEFGAPAPAAQEVNLVNEYLQQPVDVAPAAKTNFDMAGVDQGPMDIELCGCQDAGQIDIDLGDTGDISLNEVKRMAPVDIDTTPCEEDPAGEELFPGLMTPEAVDMTPQPEDIFEGTDIIELDAATAKSVTGPDVDLRDSEIEL